MKNDTIVSVIICYDFYHNDFDLRIECILLKFHWDMKVLTEVHFQC